MLDRNHRVLADHQAPGGHLREKLDAPSVDDAASRRALDHARKIETIRAMVGSKPAYSGR